MRKASDLTPHGKPNRKSEDASGDTVLGEKLKALRKKYGLIQEQVAAEVGVSRPSLIGYESGATMPPVRVLLRLAAFYDVALDELVGHLKP